MDNEELERKLVEREYTKEINLCYILSFGAFFVGLYFVSKGYLAGFLGSILSPILGVYLAAKRDKHTLFYGILLILFFSVWIMTYITYLPK